MSDEIELGSKVGGVSTEPQSSLTSTPPERKKLGKGVRIFVKVIGGIILLLALLQLSNLFLVGLRRPPNNGVEPFNGKSRYLLSEAVSYFYRDPEIGEAVLFRPEDTYWGLKFSDYGREYVGIITDIKEDKYVRTLEVYLAPGKPWVISQDKIIRRIYYPRVNESHLKALMSIDLEDRSLENKTSNFVKTTTGWEVYEDETYKFRFEHPGTWSIEKKEIAMGPGSKVKQGMVPYMITVKNAGSDQVSWININPEGGNDANINPSMVKSETTLGGVMVYKYQFEPDNGFITYDMSNSMYDDMNISTRTLSQEDEVIVNQILSTFEFVN